MHAGPARVFALLGSASELGASHLARRRLGEVGDVYGEGRAGVLDRLATGLTAAGAAVTALGGRRRLIAGVGGGLLLAGSLAKRLAVLAAGIQSAHEPASTIGPQRRRLERNGARALTGPAPSYQPVRPGSGVSQQSPS